MVANPTHSSHPAFPFHLFYWVFDETINFPCFIFVCDWFSRDRIFPGSVAESYPPTPEVAESAANGIAFVSAFLDEQAVSMAIV